MNNRIDISYIVIFGDSLSDIKTSYTRKLLGFIPERYLTDLNGHSPKGSFTNGYAWSNNFIFALANEFTIRKIKKLKKLNSTDIADAVINNDSHIKPVINHYYDLKNNNVADFDGIDFARIYAEGGLSSYNYKYKPSMNIARVITRWILPTLESKRELMLKYDKDHHVSHKHKSKTLVIEWSGANDLITVNAEPTKLEVRNAIKARMQNMNELINNGYFHFVLFNLPDLSLTPRYQAKSKKERRKAKKCSNYFNEKLIAACDEMQEKHPNCTIKVFDVNSQFKYMYHNPEKFHFDKDKLRVPYIESKDFKMLPNATSPADGYLFWDSVHLSGDGHEYLGQTSLPTYLDEFFNFVEPESNYILSANMHGFFNDRYISDNGQNIGKTNDDFYVDYSKMSKHG